MTDPASLNTVKVYLHNLGLIFNCCRFNYQLLSLAWNTVQYLDASLYACLKVSVVCPFLSLSLKVIALEQGSQSGLS